MGQERKDYCLSQSWQAGHSYRMCMQIGRARGFPWHILAHRTQWVQFPAMLAFTPMGPVPIPLYWAAVPLPHAHHVHRLTVTVSLASRDSPATSESEGSHKTLSTSHLAHCHSRTYVIGGLQTRFLLRSLRTAPGPGEHRKALLFCLLNYH